MADTRKIVRVFLASPGDMKDERNAAKTEIDGLNTQWINWLGYHVELVGWEDTVSAFGRPQASINRDLEQCEYFIGMMWRRWGTPPDNIGHYTSGFEEEFELSVKRRHETGQPEISLFFKEIDPELTRDPGDELKKVLSFKERIQAERVLLYQTFKDPSELQTRFGQCIAHYVQTLHARETSEVTSTIQARPVEDSKPRSTADTGSLIESLFPEVGKTFLSSLLSKTKQETISKIEVARFKLLASSFHAQGNDKGSIGVHDANILFANRNSLVLSRREVAGLVNSGLEHFSSENTPLWHWYKATDGFNRRIFSYCSITEPPDRRLGALFAMKLIQDPLATDDTLKREMYFNLWFSDDTPSTVKVAALEYLGSCGVIEDVPAIKAELDRGDYQTSAAAVDAILRISLRDSRNRAIAALYDLQPERISQTLLESIFDASATIDAKILMEGLGHKCSGVRQVVTKLLRESGALETASAKELLSDNDVGVRLEAVLHFESTGKPFSNEEAKNILVKPVPTGALGYLAPAFITPDETFWNRYRESKILKLSDQELDEAVKGDGVSSIFDKAAYFSLVDRQFTKRGDELRNSVTDRFKKDFSESVARLTERSDIESLVAIDSITLLEDSLRRKFTRQGLDILCRNGGAGDLSLIREILRTEYVEYSVADVEYFGNFGEWEDVQLIISLIAPSNRSGPLLTGANEAKYRAAARAIYKIGKARLAELLALDAPAKLMSRLLIVSSSKAFLSLENSVIALLFRSENDLIRKTAAVKCVRTMPKRRVAQLLNDYLSDDKPQYYNVIHWLDLGASLSIGRSVLAADKVLLKLWQD